jgi:hypothetical protein
MDVMHIDNVYDDIQNRGNITLHTSSDAHDIEFFSNIFLNTNVKSDVLLDDRPHTYNVL